MLHILQKRHQTTLADVTWVKTLTAAKIPRSGFTYRFDKSSGPGGQHVNKVNTKATLRMDAATFQRAEWIPKTVKSEIFNEFPFLTADRSLLVQSDRYRSQVQNVEDCYERLATAFRQVKLPDRPHSQESTDKWNKIAKKEDKRRLELKKRTSAKKQSRKRVFD